MLQMTNFFDLESCAGESKARKERGWNKEKGGLMMMMMMMMMAVFDIIDVCVCHHHACVRCAYRRVIYVTSVHMHTFQHTHTSQN
jgi:hypothetical protein